VFKNTCSDLFEFCIWFSRCHYQVPRRYCLTLKQALLLALGLALEAAAELAAAAEE
jgi:hypothetical protein